MLHLAWLLITRGFSLHLKFELRNEASHSGKLAPSLWWRALEQRQCKPAEIQCEALLLLLLEVA